VDILTQVLQDLVSVRAVILIFVGALIGLIFGTIPGLTATMGVAILLPITFTFPPAEGILLLIGVYVGGISGGLVAATLLGIPGTPSSVATTFDAYPMAKKGEPLRALSIGIVASLIGGIVGFIILVTAAPIIANFAVQLTPFEYTSLIFLALGLISVLSAGNVIKGITSGFIGLTVALIGFAPIDGSSRFTFEITNLSAGVELLPLMMGLFAIGIILISIQEKPIGTKLALKVKGLGISIKEFTSNSWNILRSSLIGVGFGILPGMGSGVSNLVAYAQAQQASKRPESFGKGNPEGIYSAESSNNAAIGGALIPLLALGIPGDTVTAMLLGGFVVHGIQPGPLLLSQNPDIVYVVFVAFLIAIFVVFIMQLFGIRIFVRILQIPKNYLYSILIVLAVVGAYSNGNNMFDIYIMLAFGAVGYFLMKNSYPLAPLILGFVLGPLFEQYLRRALMNAENGYLEFFTRPISATLILITLAIIVFTFYKEITRTKKTTT